MDETLAASAADVTVDGVEYKAEISRSSSALVYRGWQAKEGRAVAVKVLGLTRVPAGALEAATSLPSHPHIVAVHGAGVNPGGRAYLVMDYLGGGSMAERIERDGPLPWAEALQAGAKLALAVDAAHQARLLHLGIKPANVLLTSEGDVRLGDFVTTELRRRSPAERSAVSFAYVAPEVLAGATATRASDIFSLGATIFAMITGHPPAQLGDGAITELRRAGAPGVVARALGQALAEDPGTRPASARAFAQVLRDATAAPDTGAGPGADTDASEMRSASPNQREAAEDEAEATSMTQSGVGRDGKRAGPAVLVLLVAALVAYLGLRPSPTPETSDQAGGQTADQVTEGGAVAAAAVDDLGPLGIEGSFVAGPDAAIPGLEVASVDPSSPAAATGIASGDLITRIAGISLASDSTSDYETRVGNRDPQAALALQVLRPTEGVVYTGEVNGEALAPVIDRDALADLPAGDGLYDSYVEIIDETAALKVAAPSPWTEIDVQPFVDLGPNVQAAPSLADFRGGWSSPGLNVTATTRRDVDDLEGILASFVEPDGLADCATEGPRPYADGAFSGLVQYFSACGGTSSGFVQVVATPDDRDFVLQLGVQLFDQDDFSALSAVVASARVVGAL